MRWWNRSTLREGATTTAWPLVLGALLLLAWPSAAQQQDDVKQAALPKGAAAKPRPVKPGINLPAAVPVQPGVIAPQAGTPQIAVPPQVCDLAVQSVEPTITPEGMASFEVRVANIGSGLSRDTSVTVTVTNSDSQEQRSLPVVLRPLKAEGDSEALTVALEGPLGPGEYTYRVQVERPANERITENNVASGPFTIAMPPRKLPDMRIAALTAEMAGDDVVLQILVANGGERPAPGYRVTVAIGGEGFSDETVRDALDINSDRPLRVVLPQQAGSGKHTITATVSLLRGADSDPGNDSRNEVLDFGSAPSSWWPVVIATAGAAVVALGTLRIARRRRVSRAARPTLHPVHGAIGSRVQRRAGQRSVSVAARWSMKPGTGRIRAKSTRAEPTAGART